MFLKELCQPVVQDMSAHVMARMARARLAANLLAFSDPAQKATYRAELKSELWALQQEYRTLLYGGPMMLQVCLSLQPDFSVGTLNDLNAQHFLVHAGRRDIRPCRTACSVSRPGPGR